MGRRFVTAIDEDHVKDVGLTPNKRYGVIDINYMKPEPELRSTDDVPKGIYLDDGIDEIGNCMITIENDDGEVCSYGDGWFKGKFKPPGNSDL